MEFLKIIQEIFTFIIEVLPNYLDYLLKICISPTKFYISDSSENISKKTNFAITFLIINLLIAYFVNWLLTNSGTTANFNLNEISIDLVSHALGISFYIFLLSKFLKTNNFTKLLHILCFSSIAFIPFTFIETINWNLIGESFQTLCLNLFLRKFDILGHYIRNISIYVLLFLFIVIPVIFWWMYLMGTGIYRILATRTFKLAFLVNAKSLIVFTLIKLLLFFLIIGWQISPMFSHIRKYQEIKSEIGNNELDYAKIYNYSAQLADSKFLPPYAMYRVLIASCLSQLKLLEKQGDPENCVETDKALKLIKNDKWKEAELLLKTQVLKISNNRSDSKSVFYKSTLSILNEAEKAYNSEFYVDTPEQTTLPLEFPFSRTVPMLLFP